jgi:hypothetical protein
VNSPGIAAVRLDGDLGDEARRLGGRRRVDDPLRASATVDVINLEAVFVVFWQIFTVFDEFSSFSTNFHRFSANFHRFRRMFIVSRQILIVFDDFLFFAIIFFEDIS